MSDRNSADDRSSERPVTPVKQTKTEPKGKGKRAASPSDYEPSDAAMDSEDEEDDQQEDDEDAEFTPKKKQRGKGAKNGSKKSTPVKKPKTGGAGSSSPSGKSGWTVSLPCRRLRERCY